ncbi:MAG: PilZ domain-containing protein [Candidatus Omnitrophota bacterium]
MRESNNHPKNEQRQNVRVPVYVDFYYLIAQPPEIRIRLGQEEKKGSMVNISSGGIGFVSDVELPSSTEVDIKFCLVLKDIESPSLSVTGQVKHCRFLPELKTYRIGIAFNKINEKERGIISEFVKNFL